MTWAATLTVINTNDNGVGSLRQAILDGVDGDQVIFDNALSAQTIVFLSSIVIDQSLDIVGLGADQLTLSGNGNTRMFDIISGANVTITGLSFVDGNDPVSGGAISVSGGTTQLTVQQCQFLNNTVGTSGGAINNVGSSVSIFSSTLSGNISNTFGGAINNTGVGQLFIRNSTLSGNSAMNSDGGAITNLNGTLDIANSTVINNFALMIAGGIGNNPASTIINVRNTIVAGNMTGSGNGIEFGGASQITSGGGNFIGMAQGAGSGNANTLAVFTDPTDQVGTVSSPLDPLLSVIGDNGGPTLTHIPMGNSLVVDAGIDIDLLANDQRGFARVINGAVDIGAVEITGELSEEFFVDGFELLVSN